MQQLPAMTQQRQESSHGPQRRCRRCGHLHKRRQEPPLSRAATARRMEDMQFRVWGKVETSEGSLAIQLPYRESTYVSSRRKTLRLRASREHTIDAGALAQTETQPIAQNSVPESP